ncbi:MAG: UbiA-like polyprenyltransferase [Ginsengibacter sp.]
MRKAVLKYLSLIKFSHTIFAMPFALIGFSLAFSSRYTGTALNKEVANYSNNVYLKFILVVLCMVFARSAAMAFNRWLDANYDAKNPRTAVREIPSGVIKPVNALLFVIINCILFITCTYFINILCFYLSFVALFVILFYSYTKRFTTLCHLVLGIGLALAPIGAFLAVTGMFRILPVIFSFIVLFWVSGFDIIYALQDEDFDKSYNLRSIPSAFGKIRALRISEMLHVLAGAMVVLAGYYGHFHFLYWTGALLFLSLLIYQHTIVKHNDLSKVNLAFATTNGIGSVIFSVFVICDIFLNNF